MARAGSRSAIVEQWFPRTAPRQFRGDMEFSEFDTDTLLTLEQYEVRSFLSYDDGGRKLRYGGNMSLNKARFPF